MGLEDNGLSYTMEMISKNEDDFLEVGVSILLVHQPSEEWIKTPDFTLPIAEFFKEEDPAKTCVDLCLTITLATVLNLKL